ncbi:uncharacterized protein TRIADDRAFT_59645 [Trichoplax adhaerens]|uniref:Uncharacterized protein n=1 Tax=Trichoplax adhaerens TaxID=10228 RepID=B3S5N6_TRIAD|nr:hypothetical protein TRIADDRAFT_59645 [Trichoplax adhaerens]EDV21932.1 hypothetical protein TRIADDRAFT_59645 [Trichoplax adhaerens]|eukprot:XP_002115569.1 hypothetical protein TRIADDRAFT_59645 [Trichoplax adhaerens]
MERDSPFMRPKLGKNCDGICVILERIICENKICGLPDGLIKAISSISRWDFVAAATPHVIRCCSAMLANRNQFDRMNIAETKLMYTLHWILLDARSECSTECILSMEVIQLFVQLMVPHAYNLRDADLTFRLEKGIRIWKALRHHQAPEVPAFTGQSINQNPLLQHKMVTNFDTAVVRCLTSSNWSEQGITWAIIYLQQQLTYSINSMSQQLLADSDNIREARSASCSRMRNTKRHVLQHQQRSLDHRSGKENTQTTNLTCNPLMLHQLAVNDISCGNSEAGSSSDIDDVDSASKEAYDLYRANISNAFCHIVRGRANPRLCDLICAYTLTVIDSNFLPWKCLEHYTSQEKGKQLQDMLAVYMGKESSSKSDLSHEALQQVGQAYEIYNSILILVVNVFKHLGCQYGCGEGIRGTHGDKLRSQTIDILIRLRNTSKVFFTACLRNFIVNNAIQDTLDFYHALLGFCCAESGTGNDMVHPMNSQNLGSIENYLLLSTLQTFLHQCQQFDNATHRNATLSGEIRQLLRHISHEYPDVYSRIVLTILVKSCKLSNRSPGLFSSSVPCSDSVPSSDSDFTVSCSSSFSGNADSSAVHKPRSLLKKLLTSSFKERSDTKMNKGSRGEISPSHLPSSNTASSSVIQDTGEITEQPMTDRSTQSSATYASKSRNDYAAERIHSRNTGASVWKKHLSFLKLGQKAKKLRRESSILSEEGSAYANSSASIQAMEIKKYLENLNCGVLDFSFLIECSQPGSVPSPALLTAIFNLKSPIVARALIFAQLAHLVNRCRHNEWPTWMTRNYLQGRSTTAVKRRNARHKQAVAESFYQWGVAIGNKLRELHESETIAKHNSAEAHFEPFEITTSCPYSLKLVACQLIYEITAFFVENPSVKTKIDNYISPRREEPRSSRASVKQTVGFKRRRRTIRQKSRASSANSSPRSRRTSNVEINDDDSPLKVSSQSFDDRKPIKSPSASVKGAPANLFERRHSSVKLARTVVYGISTSIYSPRMHGGRTSISKSWRKKSSMAAAEVEVEAKDDDSSIFKRRSTKRRRQSPLDRTISAELGGVENRRRFMSTRVRKTSKGSTISNSFRQRLIHTARKFEQSEDNEPTSPTVKSNFDIDSFPWIRSVLQLCTDKDFSCKCLQQGNSKCYVSCHRFQTDCCYQLSNIMKLVCSRIHIPDELFIAILTSSKSPYENFTSSNKRLTPFLTYLDKDMSCIACSPFSVMSTAAATLPDSTYESLIPVTWQLLLESELKLSSVASTVFLLASSRKEEYVQELLRGEFNSKDASRIVKCIQRFSILWRNRYNMSPKLPHAAYKYFKFGPPRVKFTLPSPALGLPAQAVPDISWVFASHYRNPGDLDDKLSIVGYRTEVISQRREKKEKEIAQMKANQRENYKLLSIPLISHACNQDEGEETEGQDKEYNRIMQQPFFPPSLTASVIDLIACLENAATDFNGVSVMKTSLQVIWSCLVEEPSLFFRHFIENLLDRGSQDLLLQSIRKLLLCLPYLPQAAAHFLLNHLVGVVMHQVNNPTEFSKRSIMSVMSVVWQVASHVHDVKLKDIKATLRKEQSDSTVLICAGGPGAKKLKIFSPENLETAIEVPLHEDMQMGRVYDFAIARSHSHRDEYCLIDQKSDYVFDSKDYVIDFYSHRNNPPPNLLIKKLSRNDKEQRISAQIITRKLAEVGKLLFTQVLVHVDDNQILQQSLQLHSDLVKLQSFPRTAIDVDFVLCGIETYGRELITTDIVQRLSWINFILELFQGIGSTSSYLWSDEFTSYINIINGAILMHSEENNCFYQCQCFNSSKFLYSSYNCILPTLIQIYAHHYHNSLAKQAIECLAIIEPLLSKPNIAVNETEKDNCYDSVDWQFDFKLVIRLCVVVFVYAPESKRSFQLMSILNLLLPYYYDHLREKTRVSKQKLIDCKLEVDALNEIASSIHLLLKNSKFMAKSFTIPQKLYNHYVLHGDNKYKRKDMESSNHSVFIDVTSSITANQTFSLTRQSTPPYRQGTFEQASMFREGEKYDGGARIKDSQRGDYLLSIVSTFVTVHLQRLTELSHYLPRQYSISDVFDNNCFTIITDVTVSLFKLALYDSSVMRNVNISRYFTQIMPAIDWLHPNLFKYFRSFMKKLDKVLHSSARMQAFQTSQSCELIVSLAKGLTTIIQKKKELAGVQTVQGVISSLVSFLYENVPPFDEGISGYNDTTLNRVPDAFQQAVLDLVVVELYTVKEFSCLRAACNNDFEFGDKTEKELVFIRFLIPLTFQIAKHNFLGMKLTFEYIKNE